jgi:hypothetical protein
LLVAVAALRTASLQNQDRLDNGSPRCEGIEDRRVPSTAAAMAVKFLSESPTPTRRRCELVAGIRIRAGFNSRRRRYNQAMSMIRPARSVGAGSLVCAQEGRRKRRDLRDARRQGTGLTILATDPKGSRS